MDKLLQDVKSLRSILLLIPITYYLLLLWSLLAADPAYPRTVYYYNELAFVPLLVLLTISFFQREFGGGLMEIYATYPLSLSVMVLRKFSMILGTVLLLHAGWVMLYFGKFHRLETDIYSFAQSKLLWGEATWLQLFAQALPGYLLIISFVILIMVLSKKLYTGLAAGFALWLIEVLSSGKLLERFALFTKDIPPDIQFLHNRWLLTGIAVGLALAAIWSVNQRRHWIGHDEGE
jgi:hypothetical protein